MSNETVKCGGACYDQKWRDNALARELKVLANLPPHNVNRAGSPFYLVILKIASIIKTCGPADERSMNMTIKRTCAQMTWIPQYEIDYQWRRAYARAKPFQ